MIVALYLVDEEVWNAEMKRLKPAQPPRKETLPTTTIPPNPVPKRRIRKKAVESPPKREVDKLTVTEDMIKQRQREEEERHSKKIFEDMQKKRDDERRAKEAEGERRVRELQEAEEKERLRKKKEREDRIKRDRENGLTKHAKGKKNNRTAKGQQKKQRAAMGNSRSGGGGGQGRDKSRGKSKKGSTSFPLSKPSQRASMRVPLPTAEPGRRGTLVGDDAAEELLQKFESVDRERYELYANLHGYEAAIEQMQRDLETPPTRPDSGASPSFPSPKAYPFHPDLERGEMALQVQDSLFLRQMHPERGRSRG